jgi:heme-degrading monooxygenase HmoA
MSYLSHIRFDIKKGERENFLRLFEEAGMLTRPKAITGYQGGTLAESEGENVFIVIARWQSKSDYEQWQATSMQALDKNLARAFIHTLNNPKPGQLFHSVLEVQ